jgi:hypothetical protein
MRRKYDAVDSSNQPVTGELERRWNWALAAEVELEGEITALEDGREPPSIDAQKRELRGFARDIEQLWDDPHSSLAYKKRLLRIALKEITATSEVEMIWLVLHWRGGDHTQVEFPKIRTGQHRYATGHDIVATRKLKIIASTMCRFGTEAPPLGGISQSRPR